MATKQTRPTTRDQRHTPTPRRCSGPCRTCDNRRPDNAADVARFEAEAQRKMEDAVMNLLLNQPFFGILLCGMRRTPTWDMPTMAVDGVNIFYNPKFTAELPPEEVRGVVCHEVLHLAYSHLFRINGRHQRKWNVACDYAVNRDILEQIKLKLPSFVLYDQKFGAMSAEEIYRVLPEPEYIDADSWDEHLPPGCSAGDAVGRIVQAAAQATGRGTIPEGVQRAIDKLRNPRVAWNQFIYGQALDRFQRVDYHAGIRAHSSYGIARAIGVSSTWVPGLGREEAQDLVIWVDTSGSVDKRILTFFASEMQGIIEMAERTFVMSADADVHEVVELSKWSDLFSAVAFKGGGGTDFRPGFAKVEELGIRPVMGVYFTDGYGTFPENPPSYPVVWAFTKQHNPPPWGDSVIVECDDD